MDYQPGCPARSLAGHDKDHYYIILSVEGEQLVLADGRTRTQEKPKRKNKKHIQAEKKQLIKEFPVTDDEIYARLKSYIKCEKAHKLESCDPVV